MTRPSVSSCLFLCALAAAALSSTGTEAFVPSSPVVPRIIATQSIQSATALNAQKKRRRKRKVAAADDSGAAAAAAPAAPSTVETSTPAAPSAKLDAAAELKAAEMAFDLGADGFVEDDVDAADLPLPDIREARSRRREREEEAEIEAVEEEFKPKVDRNDLEAMKRLLEAQPFADADETLFEEEAYGTVSALLGEKAKPFLGIGPGPLQVAHFIGSLVILLMAFVEYPGFPLTNLPTPLRNCFQGGLATIYAVNAVMAILATFKAGERGQNPLLWGIKTVTVGGLAFDQLTQLPTTEEVERRRNVKGKRALGKNKSKR